MTKIIEQIMSFAIYQAAINVQILMSLAIVAQFIPTTEIRSARVFKLVLT